MENQYRIGLLRMERAIRERMGSAEIDTVMPADLINAKPAAAAVREFLDLANSRNLWTKRIHSLRLPINAVSLHWVLV